MNKVRASITSVCLAFALAACGGNDTSSGGTGGDTSSGGSGGSEQGGSGGSEQGGAGGSGGEKGGSGGGDEGGSGGSEKGGSGGSVKGGSGGSEKGGAGGSEKGGAGGSEKGGAGGGQVGGRTGTGQGGKTGGNTGQSGGEVGSGGQTTSSGGTTQPPQNAIVTSSSGDFWKVQEWKEASSGNADVTVNDSSTAQTFEGFAGAFNEIGWAKLTSDAMKKEALEALFGEDGCHLPWARIPIGASDYAISRYTLDDTGSDVTPDGSESNRPQADTSLSKFSLSRDEEKLIPYIKAAQEVKPDIRFWASPWTPPVWMKTGYKKNSGADSSQPAKKPSYYDGGNMKSDTAILTAYAEYFKKFVEGYKEKGINIEIVSPQNEPGYDQNYPSCLWDGNTYKTFIGQYLGPAMKDLGVKVMLGTLSNDQTDISIANGVVGDGTAKGFCAVVGVQWSVLDKVNGGTSFGGIPIWVSETKCGNYPWNPSGYPSYNNSKAPNDMAYAVESWGYIRDAIKKGKVTGYDSWNMVLDASGLGIDTTRDWKQNALLVADGGKITKTPFYYVFRHCSQYLQPNAKVVGTSGGDAIAFKNPDNSLVAVMYSNSAKSTYTVKIGGKMVQFSMPNGWATVFYNP